MPTSNGTPPMKLVAVEVKNSCCSPGARKPVETAPRSANDRREVEAAGEFAGHLGAEVGIVLAAHRHARQEFLGELRFDVDVGADRVALLRRARCSGLKAREALRTGRRAHDRPAIVRRGFARVDAVALAPRLDAEREVHGLGEAAISKPCTTPALKRELVVVHPARVEAGLRSRADTRR